MKLLSDVLLFLVCTGLWAVHAQLSSSGRTVVLGGQTYFVPPSPVAQFKFGAGIAVKAQLEGLAQGGSVELIPFSLIATASKRFSTGQLQETVSLYQSLDDVWSPSFLQGIYLSFNGSGSPTATLSTGEGTKIVVLSDSYAFGVPLTKALPPGPYFVEPLTGNIFEAWLLYSDENQSFLYGTVADGKGGFTQLSAHIDGAATESVAVPSRLYFEATPKQPLAGARLAVKDIFDVAGLRTGCGNRAFYTFNPPKNATAPAIQRLLDGGAILVGKVKASQFANGETATDDWVDYHAPYNPRGEGYQDGSSSSTGSGTAVAAYPWLDYAVGSDTGGSMRGPAGANGVFGNRPSHGAVVLDDVMPLSPELDTAGIFARDAKTWQKAGLWWYENFTSFSKFPKTILFPVDSFGSSFLTNPPKNGTANAMFNTFIQKLEAFLNTTRTEINLTNLWTETSPLIANVSNPPPPLRTVLNTTYADLISLDQIALVADPFIDAYKAAHNGQNPFIDPAPLVRWDYGRSLNDPNRKAEALNNKTVFMNWFQDTVIGGTSDVTCSPSIFLYPQSSGGTQYRNRFNPPPGVPFGFSTGRIATHAEVPDMVVPVGELPYNSTISLTTEFLPVTLSFITQKNCDLMLFNLFAALQGAGILKSVKTGQTLFM